MFEYHGWITLANSAQGEPRERAGELKAITALVERLGGPYLADMRYMNGTRFIHLAGFSNHRFAAVSELYAEVARGFPEAYGILHVWDDEAEGSGNEFKALRLARGKLSWHLEELLSPRVPLLEDP